MREQLSNAESIAIARKEIEEALKKGWNVLTPIEGIDNVPAMHKVTVETVTVSDSPDDKEIYPQTGTEKDKPEKRRWSLHKSPLMDLMSRANVQWDWTNSGRLDDRRDKDYISTRMVGAIQRLDGTFSPLAGSADIDFSVESEIAIEEADRTATSFYAGKDWWEKKTEKEKKIYLDRRATKAVLQKKKFGIRLVETAAMLRALKGFLHIKETYTYEQIKKPFVVARLVFQPDNTDPVVRTALLEMGFRAAEGIYGIQGKGNPFVPQRSLPANTIEAEPNENGSYEVPSDKPEPDDFPEDEQKADPQETDFENADDDTQLETLRSMAKALKKELIDFKNSPDCEGFKRTDMFRHLRSLIDKAEDDIPF